MAAQKKSSDRRAGGASLGTRFSLTMSIALALVMAAAGVFLFTRAVAQAEKTQELAFLEAVKLRGKPTDTAYQPIQGSSVQTFENGTLQRIDVVLTKDSKTTGWLYRAKDIERHSTKDPRRYENNQDYEHGYEDGFKDGHQLFVPQSLREQAGEGLPILILGVTLAVILVGALVAWIIGGSVSHPLALIVEDIAQIARGNLRHRTRVRAGGEVMQLARSIDRMAADLDAARDAAFEQNRRERELSLASDVREALLPQTTPKLAGHELAARHVSSPTPGGDFHDFIEYPDGRVGLLVCDVSGRGVPGAMIGAVARSYLRAELLHHEDVSVAFARANRALSRDLRRGMFVSAMFTLVDPREGVATVVCAGHKLPLVRYTGEDGRIRVVHPEGIALGLDKGPVFERALKPVRVPLEPGDRLVCATTGAPAVQNPQGFELGEKEFFKLVLQHSARTTEQMLDGVLAGIEAHADGAPFPTDLSIVAVSRPA
jgi:serine phosphatase RsbU (regulator of sigma subunit)